MTFFQHGYLVWALFIGVFLALELPAALNVAPWPTLSSTAWHAQAHWPILREVIAGFALGLAVHLITKRSLLLTAAGGFGVALAAHYGLSWP